MELAHSGESLTSPTVPAWAADAVFYQIFPERFRNGDPSNDPTRESLESPESVPETWTISPWTGDWYARADWEKRARPELLRERRVQSPLRRRPAGRARQARLPAGARHQRDLFQPRVLRPLAAQVRRQLVSSHRSVLRPRSGGRFRADGRRRRATRRRWHWTAADKLFLELVRQAARARAFA